MASVALLDGVSPLETPDWRRAQLLEVLRALGLAPARTRRQRLDKVGRNMPGAAPEEVTVAPPPTDSVTRRYVACRTERGTVRGYHRHLAAYERPCDECHAARQAQLAERWDALGLNNASYVRLPE